MTQPGHRWIQPNGASYPTCRSLQGDHISTVPELASEIGTEPDIDYATTTIPINVALLTPDAAQKLAPLADSITLTVSIRPAPNR